MKSECSRITSVFYKSYGTDLTQWKREKKGKKTCLILSLLMHGTAEGNVPVCSYRSEQSSGQTQRPSDCQREELCDSCTELNCLGAGRHFSPPLCWSRRTLTSRQEQFWYSALTRLLIKYSRGSTGHGKPLAIIMQKFPLSSLCVARHMSSHPFCSHTERTIHRLLLLQHSCENENTKNTVCGWFGVAFLMLSYLFEVIPEVGSVKVTFTFNILPPTPLFT